MLPRTIWAGTRISFTTVANISPIPTATGAGTPRNSTRTGTVMVPAPTPVRVMKRAMMSPMRYGIEKQVLRCAQDDKLICCGRRLDVNAAFHFAPGPAAGARIVGVERQRGARLAADG